MKNPFKKSFYLDLIAYFMAGILTGHLVAKVVIFVYESFKCTC